MSSLRTLSPTWVRISQTHYRVGNAACARGALSPGSVRFAIRLAIGLVPRAGFVLFTIKTNLLVNPSVDYFSQKWYLIGLFISPAGTLQVFQ